MTYELRLRYAPIPAGKEYKTDVALSCPKVQKSDFQSQFSMSKMMRIFQFFLT